MKEYIDIFDKYGKTKKAEVIFRTYDENTNKYYIVYEYNGVHFAAKYDDIVGVSKLDINLSDEEIKKLENLLNKVI